MKTNEEYVEVLLEELSYGGRKNYLDDTLGMDTVSEILRTTLEEVRKEEREMIIDMLNDAGDTQGARAVEALTPTKTDKTTEV